MNAKKRRELFSSDLNTVVTCYGMFIPLIKIAQNRTFTISDTIEAKKPLDFSIDHQMSTHISSKDGHIILWQESKK